MIGEAFQQKKQRNLGISPSGVGAFLNLGTLLKWVDPPQWLKTQPILAPETSPLNKAPVMLALYSFLPAKHPEHIPNEFMVKN